MSFQGKKFYSVCYVVCVVFAFSISGCAEARPTRSDCIVGFHLDWSLVKSHRYRVANEMYIGPEGAERINDTSAATAVSEDGSRFYFQFSHNCKDKYATAEKVISFWREKETDLPNFELIKGPIEPSLDTIQVWGRYWSDEPQGANDTQR